MATIRSNSSENTITVWLSGLDTSYHGAARTVWWMIDGRSPRDNGVDIPSYASTTDSFTFYNLSANTSYRISYIITFAGSDYTVSDSTYISTTSPTYTIGLSFSFYADCGYGGPSYGGPFTAESSTGASIQWPYYFPSSKPSNYNSNIAFYRWYSFSTRNSYAPGAYTTDFTATTDIPEYTLHAQWEYYRHATVTFDGNGATSNVPSSFLVWNTQYSTNGDLSADLSLWWNFPSNVPVRAGYQFDYWYLDGYPNIRYYPGVSQYQFDITLGGKTIKLIAHWSQRPVAYVNFSAPGATNIPSRATGYGESGSTEAIVVIPTQIPLKDGYTFSYWVHQDYPEGTKYYPGDTNKSFRASISGVTHTLVAVWTEKQISATVKFEVTGGSGAPSPVTGQVVSGGKESGMVKVKLPNTRPVSSDSKLTFSHWLLKGGSTIYKLEDQPSDGYEFYGTTNGYTHTLVAVWKTKGAIPYIYCLKNGYYQWCEATPYIYCLKDGRYQWAEASAFIYNGGWKPT